MQTVLGLLGLLGFVVGILVLSSAVTALVVKISPTPGGTKKAANASASDPA
jgi:hypothetical protein